MQNYRAMSQTVTLPTIETIREALEDAELPPLLACVAYLTNDVSILRDEFKPKRSAVPLVAQGQGGMPDLAQQCALQVLADALAGFWGSGGAAATTPNRKHLSKILKFLVGDVSDDYVPLLTKELGIDANTDSDWHKRSVAPETPFFVAIIGAGMSGILAAYRLSCAGIPFTVLEKNSGVGGTWWENIYPGCRLDTSNFAYSYSFAQKSDWPQQYSKQAEIQKYFENFAKSHGLIEHIQFSTEVVRAVFDDDELVWTIHTRDDTGKESSFSANAIISATGQLNRPKLPEIEGRDKFQGPSFHSSNWPLSIDLKGKNVAVIGTGASAFQIIPSIADRVASLYVFQRTPPWMIPAPDYHKDLPVGLKWLLQHVPHYHRWYRFWQFWNSTEGRLAMFRATPDWNKPDSVSSANEELRRILFDHLDKQFIDHPDLRQKVRPSYAPGAKRLLRDNGVWASTLKRDNVNLITDPIIKISEEGVVTQDQVLHRTDVIIYATGFFASDFLRPMDIVGRRQTKLHDYWSGNARAHLGITVPNFPNLFLLYGPNTSLVINGSIIFMSECASDYILECIRLILESKKRSIEPKKEPFQQFNKLIDAENKRMAWGCSTVNSWYKNEFGRVSQAWPFELLEYWKLTRAVNVDDFIIK